MGVPEGGRRVAEFEGILTGAVKRARLAAALSEVPEGVRVLDVGCGLADLAGTFPSYVGCDRQPVFLAENRRRFPHATFLAWDVAAEEPPEAVRNSGPFDAVLLLALLEHLAEPSRALRRMSSLLAQDGRVVVTTPHPLGRLPLALGARLGWLSAHAAGEHETLLDREALEAAGREAGLALVSYRRFLFGLNQLSVFAWGRS